VDSEGQAQADLNKIRSAQQEGAMTDLPWLSVQGGNIIAAHVERIARPRAASF
jgi:hypothetical protein